MEKENIKKLFKDFNWKLPETKEEEYRSKYHFRDILRVIDTIEQQINLTIPIVSNPVCGFVFDGYRPPCYMNKSHTCQNCEHKKQNER